MIILTIRTDGPMAEIRLYQNGDLIADRRWPAHNHLAESLHLEIAKLLQSNKLNWHSLDGLVVFKGPGSFTGLRIGLSVANALADGLAIPIVGASGKNWAEAGVKRLRGDADERYVAPEYGAPARAGTPGQRARG